MESGVAGHLRVKRRRQHPALHRSKFFQGRPIQNADLSDLAWFRQALDDPVEAGLKPLDETATVAAWESGDGELVARLSRLDARGILDAAGFLLHDPDPALL